LPSDVRAAAREVAVVIGAFALAGVLCALLWHWWWSPAPTGVTYRHDPFFGPDDEFRSTGMYVAIAAPVGALLGVVLTWVLDRDEVVTVVSIVVGGALAAGLMAAVGHALGPESAAAVARRTADFQQVKADLRVQPVAPLLTFPVSALVGALVVLLGFTKDD
jgi:hypothetical protein